MIRGRYRGEMERVTRFELATLCLGSKYSATELHPLENVFILTEKSHIVKKQDRL